MVPLTIWQINLVVWDPFTTPGLIYRLLQAQGEGGGRSFLSSRGKKDLCVELPDKQRKSYRGQASKKDRIQYVVNPRRGA